MEVIDTTSKSLQYTIICLFAYYCPQLDRELLGYFEKTISRVFLIPFSQSSLCELEESESQFQLFVSATGCPCALKSMQHQCPQVRTHTGYYYPVFMLDFQFSLYFWKLKFYYVILRVSLFFNLIIMYLLFCIQHGFSHVFGGEWMFTGNVSFTIQLKSPKDRFQKYNFGSKNMCS